VCIVGPGKHYLSGVTYHSYGLATALDERGPVSVVLLRRLVPKRWYPGAGRVGADLSSLRLPRSVRRYDGIDWWWLPSLAGALLFLVRRPPSVVVVQWWSAAVWHTQLLLVLVARALGAKVVIEVHEVVDSGEGRRPIGRLWLRHVAPRLLDRADHVVVHSAADRALVTEHLAVSIEDTTVIPIPPFDAYDLGPLREPVGPAVEGTCRLLFFGTIRPYKGLEHLIDAFTRLCAEHDDTSTWHLTVVGETWEGWTAPAERIADSPVRDRITFVNRYVRDEEVDRHFAAADLVVLPYLRSTTSGPLLVAMAYGLPVVATRVGGLPEAVEGYSGAVLCDPADPFALVEAVRKAETLRGERHRPVRSWGDTADAHAALHDRLRAS
jgi:glycosyltransferase involved in cell wall biosynthesis